VLSRIDRGAWATLRVAKSLTDRQVRGRSTADGVGKIWPYTATDLASRAPTGATTCAGPSPTGTILTYDHERRLATWQDAPTPAVSAAYLYDAVGERVAQWVSSGGTTYTTIYVGDVYEVFSDGVTNITTTFYYAAGQRIAAAVNGVFSYWATDVLGSATVALDPNGTPTASVLYAPYGLARFTQGSMPTSRGFTGQRKDGNDLYYFHARYYDPLAGQFISADPILPDNGYALWGLSRYAYVEGNPIVRTDPSGLGFEDLIDDGGGGGAGKDPGGRGGGPGSGDKDVRPPPAPPPAYEPAPPPSWPPSTHQRHQEGPWPKFTTPFSFLGAGLKVFEEKLRTKTVRVREYERGGRPVHAHSRTTPGARAIAARVARVSIPLAIVTAVGEAVEQQHDLPLSQAAGAIVASSFVHAIADVAVGLVIAGGAIAGAAIGTAIAGGPGLGTGVGAVAGGIVVGAAGVYVSTLFTDAADELIHRFFAGQ